MPDVLDKVIISGGTSALPQVRRVLLETFAQAGDHVNWNPLDVVYDPVFAKTGTSIGACWAEHVRQKGYASASQATQRVRRGLTELYIDVDNLFHALPNSLVFDATGGQLFPIFQVGERFDRIEVDGEIEGRRRYGATGSPCRRTWRLYRQPFAVEEERSLWSHLNTHDLLRDRVPAERQADWHRQVQVTFEVNERARRSPPTSATSRAPSMPPASAPPGRPGAWWPRTRRAASCSSGTSWSTPTRRVRLASAPQRRSSRPGPCWSDRLLTDDGRHHRRADRPAAAQGRARRRALDLLHPEPWSGPTPLTQIGESVRAPRAGLLGADMVPVLDAEGRLTVESGYVRFREARSPADVVADPGSVFSAS